MGKFLLRLFIVFCISSQVSLANNHTRLNTLSKKIATIRADLSSEQSRRKQLQHKLENTEIRASQLSKRLRKTKINLAKQKKNISQAQQQIAIKQHKLRTQQQLLIKQLRAAYILGRQPYLKLLLNQKNLNEVGRTLTYYRYLTQNRITAIHNIQQTLQEITQDQQQIKNQQKSLGYLKTKQRLMSARGSLPKLFVVFAESCVR